MAATSCGCGISLQSRTAIGSHQKIVQQAVMSSSQPTMLRFPSSRHVCLSGTHLASKGISAGQSCKAKRLRLSKSITGCQVSAIATPVATPSPLNDAEERQQLAEKYGFTQIGEPVPSGITLKNVMDTFPPEVCL
jgi:hypothetical protein